MAPSRERTRSKLYTCYYSFGFTTKKKNQKKTETLLRLMESS